MSFQYEEETRDEGRRLGDFRSKLRQTLVQHKESLQKAENACADVNGNSYNKDLLFSVCGNLQAGNIIPFLGCDLDIAAVRSLRAPVTVGQPPESGDLSNLAAAAEYSERALQSRKIFIKGLQNILKKQETSRAHLCEALTIAELEVRPPLIISASYGQMLENRLRELNKKFTVISHIIRSLDQKFDGRLLIVHPDGFIEKLWANEIALDTTDYIIYKPLGSPFLNDLEDPKLQIDTVVITESDYLSFLTQLRGQKTGVPTMFAPLFNDYPLMFVGFGLDTWHYRLALSVFRSPNSSKAGITAIRIPASPIEALCWQRLGADVIATSTEQFIEALTQKGEVR